MKDVVAVLVSDIHLSLKPPRCRASEPDWMACQARYLEELNELAAKHKCPVLCGGDIFHAWNSNAELINFAMRHLPKGMISIPGNHDLPYHNLELMDKSAYGVLRAAGTIEDLPPEIPVPLGDDLSVVGFPWGTPIGRRKSKRKTMQIAVWHAYVWCDGASYPGAATDTHYQAFKEDFDTWDAVLLGDNHTYWKRGKAFNPGSFMRRTTSDALPIVGLLCRSGKVIPYALRSAEQDKIEHPTVEEKRSLEQLDHYLEMLRSSGEFRVDFVAELQRYMEVNGTPESVRKLLLETVGAANE